MQTTSKIEMIVLTGEQAGARRLLDNNTTFTISGNMDTDMVIRDNAIADERLNLITKDNEVFIQVLNGNIEIQGRKVTSGSLVKVPEYAKVIIGDTTLSYGNRIDASWKDIVEYVSSMEKSTINSSKLAINIKSNYILYLFITLTIITMLITYQVHYYNIESSKSIKITNEEHLLSILSDNGFEDLAVSDKEDRQLVLSGFLMTNKEMSKVETIIDEINYPVLIDISTGDHLAAEVRELYRVNGVETDVKTLKPGTAIVTTKHDDRELLEKLKHIALSEIPSLVELDTEYIGITNKKETVNNSTYNNEDEKRITMVVDGSPAYVMTYDKSRYYVGALLPTGHKIISIVDKEVLLEKEGHLTTLEF
ncbi:MAG: hypothetical protein ABW104_04205 [Candidatus Thiodiazotropha sp. 6PLUC2]